MTDDERWDLWRISEGSEPITGSGMRSFNEWSADMLVKEYDEFAEDDY